MAHRLEKGTLDNQNYRYVVYTSEQMQLVLMSLKPGEDIPREIHPVTTQFIKVEKGKARVEIEDKIYKLESGDSIMIPSNKHHYVVNIGDDDLKLYTLYSPPEHPRDRVDITKPTKDE